MQEQYWGKKFYESKLNTILLLVLIVLMVFALHFIREDKEKYFAGGESIQKSKLAIQIQEQESRFLQKADIDCSGALSPEAYTLGNNGCYFEHALQVESPNICEKITDSFRFDCYRMIATVKNDISICEKISAFEEKESVYSKKYGNGFNDMPALTEKELCYTDIAYLNKDKKICDKITTSEVNLSCQKCATGGLPDSSCYPLDRRPEHL